MDVKNIKEIARIMKDNGLSVLKITQGDTIVHMERPVAAEAGTNSTGVSFEAPMPAREATVPETTEQAIDFNRITEVKSPMVGVYYASPAPDAPPYVKVGSRVKKGDVLCIVEAMKLMNEIVAETDGEIVDICVGNGQVVEYSQVLFKMF